MRLTQASHNQLILVISSIENLLSWLLNDHGIKTHGSELRAKKKQAVHDERVSYLQVVPL